MGMNLVVNEVLRIRKDVGRLIEDEFPSFSKAEQEYLLNIHTSLDELVKTLMYRLD